MTTAPEVLARLETLEMRVVHQDQTIEDLNQAVLAQWKQLDEMRRQLARLGERIEAGEQRADAAGLPEPPPPHY
jgi:SlyX protein